MNLLYLNPTDVLFFRDGRPMTGSLSGYGAAWPLPHIINNALHAALWRADLEGVHEHRQGKSGVFDDQKRNQKFGALKTAGPYPVFNGNWFFQRPLDLLDDNLGVSLLPYKGHNPSSLKVPLRYPVANKLKPQKKVKAKMWLSEDAFNRYLEGTNLSLNEFDALADEDIFDVESQVGIKIDPETQTTGQDETKGGIYSAHYLRIKDIDKSGRQQDIRLGAIAEAYDKDLNCDLIKTLFNDSPSQIIVGGQQRVCTTQREDIHERLPLPMGKKDGFNVVNEKYLVKWILLSPAVFPEITVAKGKTGTPHSGGWLPNWICEKTGELRLKGGDTSRGNESRNAWRKRINELDNINARLVSAIIPKPIIVTGWSLQIENSEDGGAKPTHLAVPAGSVYYFEADNEEEAKKLAAALNWHGSGDGSKIINRRSTLMGEKGFGLGVCGTWEPFEPKE